MSLPQKIHAREIFLKTELNYFKGLSIFITVLIVCVFFAFGTLFSAMYLETKLLRTNVEFILGELMTPNNVYGNNALVPETPLEPSQPEPEWLTFSKYGLTVKFPGTWTFLDKPFESQVHFFSDRRFRDEGSADVGDFYLYITKSKRAFSADPWTLKQVTIAGLDGELSTATINNQVQSVFVLPFGKKYVELHFTGETAQAAMEQIMTLLKLDE